MKPILVGTVIAAMVVCMGAGSTETGTISGKYLETRSCDVYTGPCFANGEVGLMGAEAILTWAVDAGTWNGVDVSGLNVIAAVKASNTLGNTYQDALPARAVVIVDEDATAQQRVALADLARTMGGELTREVVDVKCAPISASIGDCAESGCARIEAAGLVRIATRCLNEGDHKCGNEETFYPPLTEVDSAHPAFTTVASYSGDGLGAKWENIDRRGAFLARFSR